MLLLSQVLLPDLRLPVVAVHTPPHVMASLVLMVVVVVLLVVLVVLLGLAWMAASSPPSPTPVLTPHSAPATVDAAIVVPRHAGRGKVCAERQLSSRALALVPCPFVTVLLCVVLCSLRVLVCVCCPISCQPCATPSCGLVQVRVVGVLVVYAPWGLCSV